MSLTLVISGFTQKIEEDVVKYEYTRPPLQPLEGLASYNFTVITPYPENTDGLVDYAQQQYDDAMAAYPEKVAEAQRIHDERVANYDQEVELAQENYRIEQEAFQQLSKLERLAAEERPELKMPRKPGVFVKPAEPRYIEPDFDSAIIYKEGVLADTYLSVEGFEKGTDKALVGTVEMGNFDAGSTERVANKKRVYNKETKQYVDQVVYEYQTPIKRPTRLTLEFEGQTVHNDIFEGTGEYVTHVSKTSPNLLDLEKKDIGDILSRINTYINDNYGYVQVPTSMIIRFPKNKGDHDDLEKAAKLAKRGLRPIGSSDGKAELAEAMEIWSNALAEGDENDKKARINSKIMQSLYKNLIETYIFKQEYVKAQDYLVLLSEMDLKRTEESWVEGKISFIEELTSRGA
ncbi:MAG: hypothetical protein HKN79_01790 [Flavobacteriales bacterium]|nr:hypothetical protein [Flavobacteriales bacterium]